MDIDYVFCMIYDVLAEYNNKAKRERLKRHMNSSGFENYNIDEKILIALKGLGYQSPSKVQEEVLPLALRGDDIIVKSQTGSGKTAAFGIPLCERARMEERDPEALILVPTRELAVQVKEELMNLGRYKKIRCAAVFGKMPMEMQANELKQRVHIIAGTPGRTMDHINRGNIDTSKIKYLVIDEADELLSMGFIEQVEDIINRIPKERVTMLFSATMPETIEKLCEKHMRNPTKIEINPEKLTVEKIDQRFYMVEDKGKFNILTRLLYIENPDSCIIFCKTKENVEKLAGQLKALDYSCSELHGGMLQKDRLDIMKSFKLGEFRFLVATDVAARGIDIENVTHVVNYDVPVEKESYVHRIGRTGRAGKKGIALTLVTPSESSFWREIQEYIGLTVPQLTVPSREEEENCKRDFITKNSIKPVPKPEKGAALNKGIMKLHISAGKDKKIRPGDIVGAVTSIEGVEGDDIGIIDVQDRFSYVEIMGGKGNLVLDSLKNAKIKGKTIKVQRANK
jgi:ATP-dependent RNA helicase DeaD